tara:strand:+ start:1199 stop:1954 length:756 start_codon:yes stop_codon:yes gene_type:complete
MVDRPATTSTLLTVASGQPFSTSLIPTAVGNSTKVFDVDSALTDTSISGAYIDEIWFQYSKYETEFLAPTAGVSVTYAASSTTCTVTLTGHTLRVGQEVKLDFTSHSSGSLPVSLVATVTKVGPDANTFDVTIPSVGSVTGNVTVYLPTLFCFYLVNTGTVTNTNQFFPLFVSSIDSVAAKSNYSTTLQKDLPLINHPVVQSGSNFTSANNEVASKQRGIMLKRGQALYVSASGSTALTNGFYCNVQGGYY